MLKFYLSTCLIWFIILVTEGLLFKEQFRKSRDKVRKELNDNSKTYGNIKTTFIDLLISLIPIIRLIILITKIDMTCNPDKYIELVKENKRKEEK